MKLNEIKLKNSCQEQLVYKYCNWTPVVTVVAEKKRIKELFILNSSLFDFDVICENTAILTNTCFFFLLRGINDLKFSHWYMGTISLCLQVSPQLFSISPYPVSVAVMQCTMSSLCLALCPHSPSPFIKSLKWAKSFSICLSTSDLSHLPWHSLVLQDTSKAKNSLFLTAESYSKCTYTTVFIVTHLLLCIWFVSRFWIQTVLLWT